jgi:DNA invertase Pin-like site-specific DNA recombinase
MTTIAYSYVRFSTPDQQKGDSLRRQLEQTQRYCQEHNLTLDTSLNLHDLGLSAFRSKNVLEGKLGAFLKAVETGRVKEGSVLLVESLDRLSRAEITKALRLFLNILEYDIKIITLIDQKVYSKDNINDMGNILYSIIIMSRSHEESLTKSKRLVASWENKRNNAQSKKLTGKVPAWLSLDKSSDAFIINQERVEIIKRIFKLCSNGYGSHKIATMFNQERIETFGISSGWQISTIKKILNNRELIGEYQPHKLINGKRVPVGKPIPNYFPRIIDDDLFLSANVSLQSRKNKGGRVGKSISNLFTHIAKCGYCGGPIVYLNKGDYSIHAKQLDCDCRRRHITKCPNHPWTYNQFERLVLTFLKELDLHTLLDGQSNITDELRSREEKIKSIKHQIQQNEENLEKLLDLYLIDGEQSVRIKNRMDTLELTNIKLTTELDHLQKEYDLFQQSLSVITNDQKELDDLISRVQDNDLNVRLRLREQIRNLVERIDVFVGGYYVVVNENPKLQFDRTARFVRIRLINGSTRQVMWNDADDSLAYLAEYHQTGEGILLTDLHTNISPEQAASLLASEEEANFVRENIEAHIGF